MTTIESKQKQSKLCVNHIKGCSSSKKEKRKKRKKTVFPKVRVPLPSANVTISLAIEKGPNIFLIKKN